MPLFALFSSRDPLFFLHLLLVFVLLSQSLLRLLDAFAIVGKITIHKCILNGSMSPNHGIAHFAEPKFQRVRNKTVEIPTISQSCSHISKTISRFITHTSKWVSP